MGVQRARCIHFLFVSLSSGLLDNTDWQLLCNREQRSTAAVVLLGVGARREFFVVVLGVFRRVNCGRGGENVRLGVKTRPYVVGVKETSSPV